MNSVEELGGGSGGVTKEKNVDHNDTRYVTGVFERISPKIKLISTPDEESDISLISLLASTESGRAMVQAGGNIMLVNGILGDNPQEGLYASGISIYAHENPEMCIQIQLGHFTNAKSKSIKMDGNGIKIDAGINGSITLTCGPDEGGSTIELTPSGITITGTLVKIN